MMAKNFCLCLFVSVILFISQAILVAAQRQIQILNLYEDDICHQDADGTLWTCKHHKSCSGLRESLQQGKRPPICGFRAERDPVVCCEPQVKSSPTRGAKAEQMCQKYGEYVYIKYPDPVGSGFSKRDTCSAVEPLIVLGVDAAPREYPHMALIGYGKKSSIQWLCGGSLISERYVVSAAHCTDTTKGPAKWVRLGEHDKNSKLDDEEGISNPTDYEIIERINHPEYKPPSVYNDIALYKLKSDVEFNEYIRPICLQVEHQFAKTYAIATGWGRTEWGGRGSDVLQKVNLTLNTRKECSDSYAEAVGTKLRDGIRDESMMCAGDAKTGKDTCQGDSGGPLQLRRKEPYCTYSLVGITSFGSKCGGNKPGVYTRVSHFVPWIESIVWP